MIDPALEPRLHELVTAFLAENARLNLSAFRTEEQCWTGNVLDSMAALELLNAPTPQPPPPDQDSHPHPAQHSPSYEPPSPVPFPHEGKGYVAERFTKDAINRTVLQHARDMRKEPTEAEALLWEQLRFDQLGFRFRRQHPVENYIVDFYCHEGRLGIEVDGPIHRDRERARLDREREEILNEKKICLLRFTNEQVFDELPSVLHTIKKHLPANSPPPVGEEPEVGVGAREGRGVRVKQEQEQNGLEPKVGVGIQEMHKVLDLGTGGGFPMLPLALALSAAEGPDRRFTGLDSVQKKVDATNRIIAAMEIPNAQCLCGRAETFGRMPEHRERYDTVLVRAVAEISVLLEYTSPFVAPGGRIVLWKSMDIEQELKDSERAQKELSCHLLQRHPYELPGDWGKRQLLVFEKTAHLSGKYPRETGVPKKKPLR